MFAVVLALVSFYVAIRVSLSEASRRLARLRERCKNMFPPKMARKETVVKRRTGAVNGIVAFQKQEARKYKKRDLSLPFMDSGSWFQSEEDSTYNKSSGVQNIDQNLESNIVNMLKIPTENQNGSIFGRMFSQFNYIFRRESSVTYVDVSDKVLSSERVKNAIKTSVMEDLKGHDSLDSDVLAAQKLHSNRAAHVLHQMRSCISSFLLKIAAWVMFKLLGKILDGIEIHRDQIENIKRVSEEKHVPMIYLPLHRSHLDYILVTFILYMNDLRAPLVAAGNNLMIPFFGALLRGLGAFFIKRKLDPQNGQRDFVYRAVLHTYMEESLKAGHSLEFFIEGGRSRTGKAVLPKAGLLSIVVDTLMSGGIKDAYIVPIAMSYEKLLDGNFISEQLGKPKEMESFTSAIMGIWRTLHSNFGTVKVDFCQPFSLKEFLRAAEYSYNSPATALQPSGNQVFFNHTMKTRRRSEYGTEIVSEDHRLLIKDLADYIVFDAFNAYSLMSTNLLSFLLLTRHRKGATLEQLAKSMNWMREEITKRNKSINHFGASPSLIKRASTLLGKNLINIDTVHLEWSIGLHNNNNNNNNNVKLFYYKPSVSLPYVLELQYYANSVLPVFLLESIIVNAAYAFTSEDQDKELYIQRSHVLKQSLELCSILQFEFIFTPPGTSICTVLNATIDDLIENSLIFIKDKNDSDTDSAIDLPDLMADDFFAYGDQSELHQQIKLNEENTSMLQFLRCILTTFIESYYVCACTLPKLIDTEFEEAAFLQECKTLGFKKLKHGQICHEECLGLDTLKNALKLFESWKIISCRSQKSQKLYSLRQYYNDSFKLKDIIDRISKYKS